MSNADNKTNRSRVQRWMRYNAKDYDNSTQAAENCANELDLCDDDYDCSIPEYIFEIAIDFFDLHGLHT